MKNLKTLSKAIALSFFFFATNIIVPLEITGQEIRRRNAMENYEQNNRQNDNNVTSDNFESFSETLGDNMLLSYFDGLAANEQD